MDTSLQRSSAVLPLSSRLHSLLVQLETAVKDLEAAKAKTPSRQVDPYKVDAVLETIASTIKDDGEMMARPGLAELVTPGTDPSRLAAIPKFFKMATSEPMRLHYYKDVIERLTQEVNAPEGGRRRRKTRSRKTKRSKTQKRRR